MSASLIPVQDMDVIRQQIREVRKTQGLTQEELAEKAGVSQRTVSAVEKGAMDPSVRTLLLILGALGIALGLTLMMKGVSDKK